MRKTTLFLLSSVSILAACYTSPEMNEGRYEDLYLEDESACRYNDNLYQHKGLRRCLEDKVAYENSNKKTVQIIQQKDGMALVVPKTYDDSLMIEKNRVYQVIEHDSNTIFVDSKANVSEEDIAKLPSNAVLDEGRPSEPPLVVEESTEVVQSTEQTKPGKAELEEIESVTKTKTTNVFEEEGIIRTMPEQDGSTPVVQVVVEAENPAPPAVIPVVEEVLDEDTEAEECCEEECCEEEQDCCEDAVESVSDKNGVTFVMQPSDDEVVISIKTKRKCSENAEEQCPCAKKKVKKIETFKKNEKEYLPLEEK